MKPEITKPYDKEIILDDLVKIIQETSGWDMQFESSIGPDTFLGADLDLKSIDLARLVTAIRKQYNNREFPYHELFMPDDQPVSDIRISEFVDFLYDHLNKG